tara:strand:+ start:62 stop:1597 length:1536 start_codon:yes stop_codon:yes gene_type:complete
MSKFRFQYLGHAGWVIENSGVKIVCDPWFNPEGTFFSSWYQFPKNDHIDILDVVLNTDAIYISHTHSDHMDAWTLNHFDKNINVYIPKYEDPALVVTLKNLGFKNVHQIEDYEDFYVGSIKLNIFKEEDHLDKDSCLLLDDGHQKVLNLNDCHLDPKIVKKLAPVDVLMLQFSGASWWPCVYDYDVEKMKKTSLRKKENNLRRAIEYAKWSKAKINIPCAGPPIFLDEMFDVWDTTRYENHNPFPLMREGVQHFKRNNIPATLINPGDTFSYDGKVTFEKQFLNEKDIYDNYLDYLDSYKKEKLHITKNHLSTYRNGFKAEQLLKKVFNNVVKRSRIYKYKLDYPINIEITGDYCSNWLLNFREGTIEPYDGEAYRYKFTFDCNYLASILEKKFIDFDYYFLSLRFKASRNPDEFDDILFALMRNMDPARLAASERIYVRKKSKNDFFEVESQGKKYKVHKYCPHLLVNLEDAHRLDGEGNIVCGIHGWKFNLETGDCSHSKTKKLKTTRI